MSAICELCGKGPITGNHISRTGTRGWVKKRSKKVFKPNLRRVKVLVDGRVQRMRICAQCLKSHKVAWEKAS